VLLLLHSIQASELLLLLLHSDVNPLASSSSSSSHNHKPHPTLGKTQTLVKP
jgi:hypothetical protein